MALVNCVHCGAKNDPVETAGYCDDCGKKLPASSSFIVAPGPLSSAQKVLTPSRESNSPHECALAQDNYEPLDYPDGKGRRSVSAEMRAARQQTASTLFGIAMIHLVCGSAGLVYLNAFAQDNGRRELWQLTAFFEVVGILVLFTLLGIWAMFQPLLPALIGLLLYLPYVCVYLLAAVARPKTHDEEVIIVLFVKMLLILALSKTAYSSIKATLSSNHL